MATIVDFPGTGEIVDKQGNITILTDQEALVNAINLWICSFKGERLYNYRNGGVLIPYLFKPMSEDSAQLIKSDLVRGLANNFDPRILVSSCTVIPDYERSTYWISIIGYCPSLKVSVYDKIGLKIQI